MNFVVAIAIGLVIGLIGGFVLRSRSANAVWLSPVLAIIGALVASGAASMFGEPGYGFKEAVAQVILAAVGVGVAAYMGGRASKPSGVRK